MTDYYHRFSWDGNKFRYKQLEFNPVLAKYLPEPGWLLSEFEVGDSIVRVDSVANGSYRLLLWKKDKMLSQHFCIGFPKGSASDRRYGGGLGHYRKN